jgi:hypothetical protein
MKESFKDFYNSSETTQKGLDSVIDVLNNANMDTANLKRLMQEVYTPNWFQKTLGIFKPEGYAEVEDLIKDFEKTNDASTAKEIIKEIY